MTYAEVILPVPLEQTFTYMVPPDMEGTIQLGMRVTVPFGVNHHYTGIVIGTSPVCTIQPETHKGKDLKYIEACLDDHPMVRHPQIPLWQWIANYYMCPIGDVLKAALPSVLKPEEGKEGTVREDFKPKMRTMVVVTWGDAEDSGNTGDSRNSGHNDKLLKALAGLSRAPQQERLYLKLIDMSHALQKEVPDIVPKDDLLRLSETSTPIFNELLKKGLLSTIEVPVPRLETAEQSSAQNSSLIHTEPPHPLSPAQMLAYNQILEVYKSYMVCLLHGVTASGKTEVYMHLIQEVLGNNRQVLLMVPEIALTTQLCTRLRRVFGNQMVVYHSKLSDNERAEIWRAMVNPDQKRHPRLILGVRSSVLLPFSQLGLVIIDEEHEPSYKQQDPAPRYNGRDVAIMLANRHGAKVLLGSATPSLETWYAAQTGRYGLVSLTERHGGVQLPDIELVSTIQARKEGRMQDGFTSLMTERLKQCITQDKQAILFLNRRGFASQVTCPDCGWVPTCPRCDVSLTYHKTFRRLECHYCGYHMPMPVACPLCKSLKLEQTGTGTERIEEQIKGVLPIAKPLRMDSDTTTTRRQYEKVLQDFESGKANILVGTQMVTKGLDFSKVQTVGVMNADSMTQMPDFRAHERAFQMMEQVAGRAGRREGEKGRVVIQCSNPQMPLMQQIRQHNYHGMVQTQLQDRQKFFFPPFSRLIMIYLKGRYEDRLRRITERYAKALRDVFGARVLGPEAPYVGRQHSMYIQQVMLKVERQASPMEVRRLLRQVQQVIAADKREFNQLVFYYDVDPI